MADTDPLQLPVRMVMNRDLPQPLSGRFPVGAGEPFAALGRPLGAGQGQQSYSCRSSRDWGDPARSAQIFDARVLGCSRPLVAASIPAEGSAPAARLEARIRRLPQLAGSPFSLWHTVPSPVSPPRHQRDWTCHLVLKPVGRASCRTLGFPVRGWPLGMNAGATARREAPPVQQEADPRRRRPQRLLGQGSHPGVQEDVPLTFRPLGTLGGLKCRDLLEPGLRLAAARIMRRLSAVLPHTRQTPGQTRCPEACGSPRRVGWK